ncbi:MAG: hypothetical protein EOP04_17395, partial [Proteobacteria bacterium]
MQPIRVNIATSLTTAERFFVEKAAELLSKDTIDTYRLRLNNAKTVLTEIKKVLELVFKKSIRDTYVWPLFEEAQDAMSIESELKFVSFRKEYLVTFLRAKKNEKDNFAIDLQKTFHIVNIVIAENQNYLENIFEAIRLEITRLNTLTGIMAPKEFHKLNRLVGYYLIELKAKGYSKTFLHNFIRAIFFSSTPLNHFDEAYRIIGSLNARPPENFDVYVGFKISEDIRDQLDIRGENLFRIETDEIRAIATRTNIHFVNFVRRYNHLHFYRMRITAQDYFQAGFQARRILQETLDVLFMGHSGSGIDPINDCFVVGETAPTKANRQNLTYQLDGKYA